MICSRYVTRQEVPLIQRKASEQWHVSFPSAVAQAPEFTKGETVERLIAGRANLVFHRPTAPPRSRHFPRFPR